jgi:hypothetical protein
VRFIGRVLRDAFRLLAAAPPALILAVAAVHLLGAVLLLDDSLGLLGVAADFAATTLLVGGLVGIPEPDGLRAALSRIALRIGPLVRQYLLLIPLFIGLALLATALLAIVIAIAGPTFGVSMQDLTAIGGAPTSGLRAVNIIFVALLALVFVPFLARLMPATAIVIDRPVGAIDSIRQSWSATRGRTIACAILFLMFTVPGWLVILVLPRTPATFLAILPTVLGVAAGVAMYRAVADKLTRPGTT